MLEECLQGGVGRLCSCGRAMKSGPCGINVYMLVCWHGYGKVAGRGSGARWGSRDGMLVRNRKAPGIRVLSRSTLCVNQVNPQYEQGGGESP